MATGGSTGGQSSQPAGTEVSFELLCQPCQDEGALREAVGLCLECHDYLCQRCFDSHTIPKPSRNHRLLDKQQMLQPQATITRQDKGKELCSHHQEQLIEYYCTNDCQLCCSVCLNLKHRTCDKALYIPDVARDLASSEEYKQAEEQLRAVLEKTRMVNEDIKRSTLKLETSFSESLEIVRQFREIMNSIIDKVEANIVAEAEERKNESLKQLKAITESFQRAQADLEATRSKIEVLQGAGQTCSMYIEMMKTQTAIKVLEAQLESADKEHFFRKREIVFSPNSDILEKIHDPEVFGKLSEVGTADRAEHIGDVYVRTGADRFNCSITGMVVLPDSRIVITDKSNASVKVVDVRNGHYITRKKLRSIPWDVAMINNKQVVVTLPFSKQLVFVTVANTICIAGTLTLSGNCYGVDYRDDLLAVSFCEPHEVQVLNLKGVVLHSITTGQLGQPIFNYPLYVALGANQKTVYVSNNLSPSLMHVGFDGRIIATYTDSQLVNPQGIVLDRNSDVFVCGHGSDSVHHLTHGCSKIGELMTVMDGLTSPSSITYCKGEHRLYVGMANNTIRVYQVFLGAE